MGDILSILVVLGVLLGMITLVGHGIWVVLAMLFGAGASASHSRSSAERCPVCRRDLPSMEYECRGCGWKRYVAPQRQSMIGLNAIEEHIAHLQAAGFLSADHSEHLLELVKREKFGLVVETSHQPTVPPQSESDVAPPAAEIPPAPAPSENVVLEETAEPQPVAAEEYAVATSPAAPLDPPVDVLHRVEQYAARRNEAARHVESLPPAPPARPWTDLLASFMEEKHIRWGELVGGLLIVCSSIALVLSFWSQIAGRPLLQFFVFNGVTASLFGLGYYTNRNWKLDTTSQGLFLIATLLVPLNFLAIAAFAINSATPIVVTVAGELVSMVVLGTLVWAASRITVSQAPLLVSVGVVVTSLTPLLVRRFVGSGVGSLELNLVGLIPALAFLLPTSWFAFRVQCREQVDEPTINELFKMLGLIAFGAIVALGMLLVRSANPEFRLREFAPIVALFGAPELVVGLVVWKRLSDSALSGLRTAGTALAVLGAGIMVASIVLAWPDPGRMASVAIADFLLLTVAAILYRMPAAHLLAAAAGAWAYVVVMPVVLGKVAWHVDRAGQLAHALLDVGSGAALMPLVFMLAVAAGGWASRGKRSEAICYGIITAVVAVASLALVSIYGFGHSHDGGAVWVYLAYAAGTLLAGRLLDRPRVAWGGSLLLLAATVQGIVFRFSPTLGLAEPWLAAFLTHAAGCLAIAVAARQFCEVSRHSLAQPLEEATLATSWLAAALLLIHAASRPASGLFIYALIVAVLWLAIAWLWRQPELFTTFQAALTAGVWLGVAAWLEREPWYAAARHPWLDPWSWQAEGTALALLSLAWVGLRLASRRWAPNQQAVLKQLYPDGLSFDRIVTGVVLTAAGGMSLYAAWPGSLWELSVQRAYLGPDDLAWRDVPYQHAHGVGAWCMLAAALVVIVARLKEGYQTWLLLAIVGILAAVCPLAAAESGGATASAWRWWLAAYLLAGSIALALREHLLRGAARLGWPAETLGSQPTLRMARKALILLCLVPLGLVSEYVAVQHLAQRALVGVASDTFFARLGIAPSYVIPLAIGVVVLSGMAIRERLSGYALAAGCWLQFIVSVAFLLDTHTPGELWLWPLLQAIALAGAVYAIAWQGCLLWVARKRPLESPEQAPVSTNDSWLSAQVCLPMLFVAAYLLPGAWSLFVDPWGAPRYEPVSSLWGWLGLASTAAAVAMFVRIHAPRLALHAIALGWHGTSILLALTLTYSTSTASDFLGFHAWMVATLVGAVLLLGREWQRATPAALAVKNWTVLTLLLASGLALRALADDPQRPWWTLAALLAAAGLWAALGCRTQRRRFTYLAAIELNLAAAIAWLHWARFHSAGSSTNFFVQVYDFFHVQCLALAVPCAIWLWLDRRWIDRDPAAAGSRASVGCHRIAATLATTLLGCVTVAGLMTLGEPPPGQTLTWLATLATAASVLLCLWDPYSRRVVFGLYLVGLITIGTTLVELQVRSQWLLPTSACLVAAYSIGTSFLWSRRQDLLRIAEQLGVPSKQRDPLAELAWLVPANKLLVIFVVAAAFVVDLRSADWRWRISVAQAAVLQTVSLGLLARGARRSQLQWATLVVGALGAIAWGWAWLSPDIHHPLLHRTAVVVAALAAVLILYALGFSKLLRRENDWTRAAAELVPLLIGAGGLAVLLVLGAEVACQWREGGVPMALPAVVTVAAALMGLFFAALAAALLPGRDPLQLPEQARTAYVYAAEAILGLLFLHLRLTMPWLFGGFFARYWPMIVMVIAFLGVGLGELFRRQQRPVLAEPMERTGALLPLLPVLAFWFVQPQVHFSGLMVVVGALYLVLAVLRKSFGYSILAALAANGGLWYFLEHAAGYGLAEHPQLWLIPPAGCVLVAAYLNRDRLSASQMSSVRYLASTSIYVSSTADIFLSGVRDNPWLPVVLAGWSIVGIFAGILLRVRAFLFLGTSFLLLALLTIIWYAAVDLQQTWLWAVTGIVTGVAIIVLFAVFEKRRDDIVQLVDRLKEWEA